jgi:hypothetical protein
MGNGGYPAQLWRLVEVTDHEIGVLPPHTIVSGMETEGIRNYLPVDDHLVFQTCRPLELEGIVEDAGMPQWSQRHRYTGSAPVGELAGDSDVVRPWIVVDKMDGEPVDQRRAHSAEQTQELLNLIL